MTDELDARVAKLSFFARLGIAIGSGLFLGIIVVSIGIGSTVTSINKAMSPLVCPGDVIVAAWEYTGRPKLAHGPELATRWICVDEATGEAHVAGYRTIITAGTVYGLILAALFSWGLSRLQRSRETRRRRRAP